MMVISMRATAIAATIVLASPAASIPAYANDGYSLYVTIKSETGYVGEMEWPGGITGSMAECNRAKKKITVGKKFPPGLFVSPGGARYSWEIVAAACKPSKIFNSGDSD